MRYGLTPVDVTLWVAAIICNAVLFSRLICSHFRRFPFFSIYTFASLLKSLVLWYTHFRCEPSDYYIVYYSGLFINSVLLSLAVTETAYELLGPYRILPEGVMRLALVRGMFVIACLSLFFLYGDRSQFYKSILQLDRLLRFLFVGSLAALWAIKSKYHVPASDRGQSLCLGIMFLTAVQGFTSMFALSGFAARYSRPIGSVAYLVTLAIWLKSFVPVVETEKANVYALKKELAMSVTRLKNEACINL